MLSISGSIKCAIIVFSVTILSSCSVLIAPIAPLAANYMLSNHSKHLQAIEPKTMILIPQQLATIKRIAVMPLENLFGDERIALIKMWPKDLAVSGVMFASNKKTGRIISEYIEENLLELGTIDVVERSRLNLVLKEQSLMQSGLGGDYIPEIVAATAGADAIFPEAIMELDQYRQFADAVSVPILANITEFGKTPLFNCKELSEAGVAMVLYPLSAFRAMSKAALEVYQTISINGDQTAVLETMQTRTELYEVLGYHAYEEKLDALFDK